MLLSVQSENFVSPGEYTSIHTNHRQTWSISLRTSSFWRPKVLRNGLKKRSPPLTRYIFSCGKSRQYFETHNGKTEAILYRGKMAHWTTAPLSFFPCSLTSPLDKSRVCGSTRRHPCTHRTYLPNPTFNCFARKHWFSSFNERHLGSPPKKKKKTAYAA